MDTKDPASMEKAKAVEEVIKSTAIPIVPLDEKGGRVGFRTVSTMEKAVRERSAGLSI